MKTITYIDLGLHKQAKEIEMFFQACKGLPVFIKVIGIEAHPEYAAQVANKYDQDKRVKILNYAISDKEGETKLYISKSSGGHGNSIYESKDNVDPGNYVKAPMTCLSKLLRTLPMSDINVLKYNIEGAEYNMLRDLIQNGIQGLFHVYCGAPSDMHKVSVLKAKAARFNSNLPVFGIHHQDFFHSPVPEYTRDMISNMRAQIKEKISI